MGLEFKVQGNFADAAAGIVGRGLSTAESFPKLFCANIDQIEIKGAQAFDLLNLPLAFETDENGTRFATEIDGRDPRRGGARRPGRGGHVRSRGRAGSRPDARRRDRHPPRPAPGGELTMARILWRPELFAAAGTGFADDATVKDGVHLR